MLTGQSLVRGWGSIPGTFEIMTWTEEIQGGMVNRLSYPSTPSLLHFYRHLNCVTHLIKNVWYSWVLCFLVISESFRILICEIFGGWILPFYPYFPNYAQSLGLVSLWPAAYILLWSCKFWSVLCLSPDITLPPQVYKFLKTLECILYCKLHFVND